MSEKIFETKAPFDGCVELAASASKRYVLHFPETGMRVEFTMLAGQMFRISGLKSDVIIDMDDVEPTLPGAGLQLVPTLQQQEKSNV